MQLTRCWSPCHGPSHIGWVPPTLDRYKMLTISISALPTGYCRFLSEVGLVRADHQRHELFGTDAAASSDEDASACPVKKEL